MCNSGTTRQWRETRRATRLSRHSTKNYNTEMCGKSQTASFSLRKRICEVPGCSIALPQYYTSTTPALQYQYYSSTTPVPQHYTRTTPVPQIGKSQNASFSVRRMHLLGSKLFYSIAPILHQHYSSTLPVLHRYYSSITPVPQN